MLLRRAHNPKVTGSNPVPATNFFGGVAQLVRARGSYPRCHWFDSSHRHQPRTSISRKQPGISVSAIPGCFVSSGQHAVRLTGEPGGGFWRGRRADRRQRRTGGSTARKRREGAERPGKALGTTVNGRPRAKAPAPRQSNRGKYGAAKSHGEDYVHRDGRDKMILGR